MAYVKWTFYTLVVLLVVSVLHYTLPHRDIVRIVNTETRRIDFGDNSLFWSNAGSGDAVNTVNRDVLFIEAVLPDDKTVRVYRNQDTGWGWPPYFKFDTADLQARASNLISTRDNPQWVIVKHYGWRNHWLSIFPNATSVKPVDDPNMRLIPWFNIVFLILLAAVLRTIQVRVRRVWRRWTAPDEA